MNHKAGQTPTRPHSRSALNPQALGRKSVHALPESDSLSDDQPSLGPPIQIHQAESLDESQPESAGADLFTSHKAIGSWSAEAPAPLSQEDIVLEELDIHRGNVSTGRVVPERVSCTLHLTFDGKQGIRQSIAESLTITLNDPDAYASLEATAHSLVRAESGLIDSPRQLNFTYGHCIIDADSRIIGNSTPLTSQEELRGILATFCKHWFTEPNPNLSLHIYRDYILNRLKANSEGSLTSLSDVKQREINNRLIHTVDRKKYIVQPDYMGLVSTDTIHEIIQQDRKLRLESNEREMFIRAIQQKATILLATCLLAGLSMKCLKQLLDTQCRDQILPLEQCHACHADKSCNFGFGILLEKQWCFMAARFDNEGDHQEFQPDIVIPIHYFPRIEGNTHVLQENEPSISKDDVFGSFDGQVMNKELACCGEGAYSKVFRVRIHPCQHKLTAVRYSRCPSCLAS